MLVEVFWTTAYCAMPHKIIMRGYAPECPNAKFALGLYVVCDIRPYEAFALGVGVGLLQP
jgi:hypothetical protein